MKAPSVAARLALAAALSTAAAVAFPADGEAPGAAAEGAAQDAASAADEAGPAVAPLPVAEAGPQLRTEELREGVGTVARSGMVLVVHYTGWLYAAEAPGYRGRKFDSSRERGQPFTFLLGEGRVIRGWEVGIVGMQVGGLRRLVIPPAMAYGDRDVGGGLIPPNSTLVFDVELLGVESMNVVEDAK